MVWTQRLEEKSFASARNWTLVIQSAVRHYMTEVLKLKMKKLLHSSLKVQANQSTQFDSELSYTLD
jgi:hypothetical protein